jgi:hypothetical protein
LLPETLLSFFQLELFLIPDYIDHHSHRNQQVEMRVTNILSAAFLAGPVAVSAAGTLGFAVGNTNPDNSCKSQQDYEKDFDALKGPSTVIRTYTSDGCDTAKNIVPAAKAKGFKVVLGVWSVEMIYSGCGVKTEESTGLILTSPSPLTRKLSKLRFQAMKTLSMP